MNYQVIYPILVPLIFPIMFYIIAPFTEDFPTAKVPAHCSPCLCSRRWGANGGSTAGSAGTAQKPQNCRRDVSKDVAQPLAQPLAHGFENLEFPFAFFLRHTSLPWCNLWNQLQDEGIAFRLWRICCWTWIDLGYRLGLPVAHCIP